MVSSLFLLCSCGPLQRCPLCDTNTRLISHCLPIRAHVELAGHEYAPEVLGWAEKGEDVLGSQPGLGFHCVTVGLTGGAH